ncbi:hypothetical protein JMJ35_007146 [Cladonia borealis]|uniref:PH domain-containing protein n=1 Tax=Cladonia borealis TaxID=184061 RepID=A0AA39QYM0_9LECA|nr:hypothetical protein JMJ35_007146 [Cladonia borealis]
MNPSSEPTASSQTLSSNLARSRSRYKAARPSRPLTSPAKPQNSNADQVQQDHEEVLSKVAPVFPSQVQPTQASLQKGRGDTREVRDRQTWSPKVTHQSETPRGQDKVFSGRKGKIAEAPRRDFKEHGLPRKTEATPGQQQLRSLSKYREEQPGTNIPSTLPTKSLTQRIKGYRGEHRRAQSKEELKRTISAPIANEPPQDIVTPAFDAPVSAVNAGERRVIVKYGQSVMSIPVTPSTTPTDIIRCVGEQISKSLSPKATVVLESFKQLGLERPLRRYEHVRDVMNSWDNDTQNTLVIIPSPTGGQDIDLDLSSVSSSQPGDTSVHIYHSQKPRHWDKRWVTLRSDGQVLIAKKNGGEASNICHLSDFDIYIPTASQISKQIRPPRKVCFAVKSQEKSSMFVSTENFVHFFSTSDKALASAWYKAVQEWRSWYLVNVMGEGKDNSRKSANGIASDGKDLSRTAFTNTELAGLTNKETTSSLEPATETLPRRPPTRGRGAPPVSYPKKLTKDASTGEATTRKRGPSIVQTPAPAPAPEPFASTGLLGRTYTLRQKAQRERETSPPNLPPGVAPLYQEEKSTSLRRTSSQHHQKPKPLIDLTPQYYEPPQHARKGRGIMPTAIPPEGLIEMATTPESGLCIPPSTTPNRRPRTSAGGTDNNIHSTRTIRSSSNNRHPSSSHSHSQSHHHHASISPEKPGSAFIEGGLLSDSMHHSHSHSLHASTSPEKPVPAFIEGGLLSDTMHSQGGTGTGRGVMTGSRTAKEPMLDVTVESEFAKGSLLERVERDLGRGAEGPVIEREKRREVDVKVGEGV